MDRVLEGDGAGEGCVGRIRDRTVAIDDDAAVGGGTHDADGGEVQECNISILCGGAFYESKNRILDTLKFISEIDVSVTVFVGREMTKKFEEFIRGNIVEVEKRMSVSKNLKGEFVVICSASKK